MNRQEKQKVIELIKNEFEKSQASFVVDMQGMSVEEVQGLKKKLYDKGGKFKVAKNTLLKIATHDMAGLNELAPYFKDQIAIVFSEKETPAIAKILFSISKENEKLKIKAGTLDKKIIDKSQVEVLATLPSREVLLAHLLGTLNAPITGYVTVLNQLIVKLLWALKQVAEKKQ